MDLSSAAVGTELGEIVGGEDVEDFDEDDAAGGRRRRGDDFVAVVLALDGFAFLDLVCGEIGGGDEASACLFRSRRSAWPLRLYRSRRGLRDLFRVAASSGCLKVSPAL